MVDAASLSLPSPPASQKDLLLPLLRPPPDENSGAMESRSDASDDEADACASEKTSRDFGNSSDEREHFLGADGLSNGEVVGNKWDVEWSVFDRIGDGSARKIGGSVGRLAGGEGKIGGSLRKIGGSEGKIGVAEIGRANGRVGGGLGGSEGKIGEWLASGRSDARDKTPSDTPPAGVAGEDSANPVRPAQRRESVIGGVETLPPRQPSSGMRKLSRAFSFSTNKSKPAPAEDSRVRRLMARWSFPKSLSSFGGFLASYFRSSLRRSGEPANQEKNDDEEEEEEDAGSRDQGGRSEETPMDSQTDGYGRTDGGAEGGHPEEEDSPPDVDEASETEGSDPERDSKEDCEGGGGGGEFLDADDCGCEEEEEEEEEPEGEEPEHGQGWVKKRVSQIEREITIRRVQQHWKELVKKSAEATSTSGKGEEADGKQVSARETSGMEAAEEDNGTPRAESSSEDSDTDVEEDEEEGTVALRSRGRNASVYRYSNRPTSLYRYSVVRPRTVIIGLGVCTETQFFSESFGDGASETESEEDEEEGAPTTPRTTPTTPRTVSPSRTSRPHSPLSDMDTESKRNSQAVSTEPSDLEDHSSVTTSDLDSCHDLAALDARKDKAYRIAHELLHTERTYVKVLHLIDQEFQFRVDHENRAHHMFPHDVIPHMFSNVKSIYKLHHDFLLPQLEERMAQWERNRRIGDIMKSFAPFLKMYTEYVRNFDNAMTLINQWQSKCPRFAAIMDEIHSMEVCGNLTLQHHMLSPVQRIPRYEMLLRDYLKKLPEDSPDRHDTEQALHLVSTAANHANDAMKKIDKFEKLLEIQESLGGAEDLVSPTRELIKEGKIIKISARSGDHQERYIFLLTDLLLLCSPRRMGGRVMSGPQYRLRAKYHVENLIVQEGDNLETANTFYIKDNNKSVELYTQTLEEKEQWLEAFIRAIHETSQRKSSLKLHFNPDQRIMDVDLGQKQPMLIRSDSVNKCMECGSQFTMVRRKHHCRACGAVVCSKCSSFKASLAYESGKSVRVCRTCHTTLQELSSSTATPSPEIDEADECSLYSAKEPLDLPFRNRGVLEVSAKTGGAVMQGFLQLKTHRKTWVKRWFALHTDFVLYSFKCEADEQALTATPVPGFTVTHLQGTRNESGISDKEKERAFKLHHSKKHYIFQAASKEESQRWVAALKKASQAELPSPVQ